MRGNTTARIIIAAILLAAAVSLQGCGLFAARLIYSENGGVKPLEIFTAGGDGYGPHEGDVILTIPEGVYSPASESIPYTILNHTGTTVAVVMIPILERITPDGREPVPTEGVGFCGTPDGVSDRWEGEVALSWYGGNLTAGEYALSFRYGESWAEGDESALYCTAHFTLTDTSGEAWP